MRSVLVLTLMLCPILPLRADGVVVIDPVAPGSNADGSTPPAGLWSVDLLIGLPTGVRVQRAIQDDPSWVVEGVVGLEAIFPVFGGGVRRRFTVVTADCEEFLVSPGIDAFLALSPSDDLFGSSAVPLIVADVDLAWRHHFTLGNCGEIGLKVGLGVGFGVIPQVALYGGWRF